MFRIGTIKLRIVVMICVSLLGLLIVFLNGNQALQKNIGIGKQVKEEKFVTAIAIEKLSFAAQSLVNDIEISASTESLGGLTKAMEEAKQFSKRLDEIVTIAEEHGIKVIEDVAQACGGTFKGKKLGKWGVINCFSLQTHKMIVAGVLCYPLNVNPSRRIAYKKEPRRSHGNKYRLRSTRWRDHRLWGINCQSIQRRLLLY